MDGNKANITFTSPPYNAGKQGFLDNVSKQKYLDGGDAREDHEFLDLLKDFTAIAIQKSEFVFVNLQLLSHNRLPLIDYQHHYREQIKDIFVWNKSQCPPNIVIGAFNTKWEYVFCFANDSKSRGFPVEWRGQYPNVVETQSNSGNEFAAVHKAGFPVAFPSWFISKFDFAKIVYDPFGGTGTTLISCEQLNRSCMMMELDPKYCDVIIQRWSTHTGKDPVRDDGVTWSQLQDGNP
jgi:DNA modification methylase